MKEGGLFGIILSVTEMKRTVGDGKNAVEYELTRKRVKNINLRIARDGAVKVSAPPFSPLSLIDAFVLKHADFIKKGRERVTPSPSAAPKLDDESRAELLFAMTRHCKEIYPLVKGVKKPFPEIKVRAMRSRWGSCAVKKGTVTFSTMLYGKDERLLRYVAAHELCHLAVPNHSGAFWALLLEIVPDAKELRRKLNEKSELPIDNSSER